MRGADSMIFLKTPPHNAGPFYHLYDYHPKRKGANPRFDQISQKILNLKDSYTEAIMFFSGKIYSVKGRLDLKKTLI